MDYLIPDKVYAVLKWAGLIALPAVAAFTGTVGMALGWEYTDAAVTIITATGTLVGALLGVSTARARVTASKEARDGRA